jgi:hypothetical protein
MIRRLNEELKKSVEMKARQMLEQQAKMPNVRRYKLR